MKKLLEISLFLTLIGKSNANFPQLSQNLLEPFVDLTPSQLASKCLAVSPSVRSPPQANSKSVDTYVGMDIYQLNGVDDLAQTVSINAQLKLSWKVQCQHFDEFGNKTLRVPVRVPTSVWHPSLSFRNSADDVALESPLLSEQLEFLFEPAGTSDDVTFIWKKRGTFTMECGLDLSIFPMDTQHCTLHIQMTQSVLLVNFTMATSKISEVKGKVDEKSTTNQWSLLSTGATVNVVNPDEEDQVSEAVFSITIKRNPMYYIFNLVAPCYLLNFLALVGFFIMPNLSDRPLFNVYLVLAFAVNQTQVLSVVPTTPQTVLLLQYVQLLAFVCIFCCAHSIVMLWLTNYKIESMKKTVFLNKTRQFCADAIGILGAIIIFVVSTLYAAKRAGVF